MAEESITISMRMKQRMAGMRQERVNALAALVGQEEQLASVKEQIDFSKKNIYCLNGIISELEHIIAELDKAERDEKADASPGGKSS